MGRLLDGGSSMEWRLTTEATSAALVPSSKVRSRLQRMVLSEVCYVYVLGVYA